MEPPGSEAALSSVRTTPPSPARKPATVPALKLSLPSKLQHINFSSQTNGSSTAAPATSSSSSSSSCSTTSTSPFTAVDFEVVSLRSSSYTSLKDIIPSAGVQSPTPRGGGSFYGCQISIRNRLVKQAACAYLLPMSVLPSDTGRRLWLSFSGRLFRSTASGCFAFLADVFERFLRAIRVLRTQPL